MASRIQLRPLSVSRSNLCKWEQGQNKELSKIKYLKNGSVLPYHNVSKMTYKLEVPWIKQTSSVGEQEKSFNLIIPSSMRVKNPLNLRPDKPKATTVTLCWAFLQAECWKANYCPTEGAGQRWQITLSFLLASPLGNTINIINDLFS